VCALSLLTGLQVLSWSRIAPLPRTLVYTSWCCLVLAWEISVCVQFLAWKEPAQVCFLERNTLPVLERQGENSVLPVPGMRL
jgi:hypothetical protein